MNPVRLAWGTAIIWWALLLWLFVPGAVVGLVVIAGNPNPDVHQFVGPAMVGAGVDAAVALIVTLIGNAVARSAREA